MSWLLRNSPLRQSFNRTNRGRALDAASDCDPKACYDSFCKHWQQVYEIILRAEVSFIQDFISNHRVFHSQVNKNKRVSCV